MEIKLLCEFKLRNLINRSSIDEGAPSQGAKRQDYPGLCPSLPDGWLPVGVTCFLSYKDRVLVDQSPSCDLLSLPEVLGIRTLSHWEEGTVQPVSLNNQRKPKTDTDMIKL